MMTILAQTTDGQFLLGVVAIIALGIVVHLYKTRCRNPKCGKWGKEKRGAPFVTKTETSKVDDWVMEITKTVFVEDDRRRSTPWEDSRRQVREAYHEKVRYEVETTREFSSIPCHCRLCGFTWELHLPATVKVMKRRVG